MPKRINSNKIRQAREEKGWTQAYLATAARLERSTIIRMEKAKKQFFSIESIKAVASVFDIDFQELLHIDNDEITNADLHILNHSKLLDELIYDKNAYDFNYEDAITDTQILNLILEFFNFLEMHIEEQLKYPQRMSLTQLTTVSRVIEQLLKHDLHIFGGKYEVVRKVDTFDELVTFNCIKIWIGQEIRRTITKKDLNNPFISTIGTN